MKKAIIFTFIIVSILLLLGSFCEEIGSEQKKLLDIKTKLEEQKQKLKLTRAEEQRALSNLYIIRKNLVNAQKNLQDAKGRASYNEKRIIELKRDYIAAERSIKDKSKELERRIVEIYKSGSGSLLEVLFASRSMADFVNRTYYFGRIIAYDAELIGGIKKQVETIKRAKSELEVANREIKGAVAVIETEKRKIAKSSIEKERIYQSLRSRRQEYERRVRELEASSLEIEKFIKSRGVSGAVSSGRFVWPVHGRIVSRFGYRRHPLWGGFHLHSGTDIAAPYGRPIISADGGEVIFSGWWDGYGKAVVIDHGRGYTTVYGHMSRVYVQAGQQIEKGQVIGLVGNTGFSTGPHLHFEIRYNGRPVDPLAYL